MRFVVLVIALAGCRQLFGIHDTERADAALVADAPDAGAPMPCSKMSMVADAFTTDDLATQWPAVGATTNNTVAVAGGQLELALNVPGYATAGTNAYFDLRESGISAAISTSGALADTSNVILLLVSQRAGYGVNIEHRGNNLIFNRLEQAQALPIGSIPYDAIAHAYVRIANAGGITTFETSPDGVTYTLQAMSALDYVTFMRVAIVVDRGVGDTAFNVFVDTVNGGVASGNACPIAQLQDTFSGSTLDEHWGRSSVTGGTLTEHDGVAELAFPSTGAVTSIDLAASTIYDLRNDAFVAEVPQMIDQTSTQGAFYMNVGALGTTAQLKISGGSVNAEIATDTGAAVVGATSYDATTQRWLRIREAGTVSFETSPDGMAWAVLATYSGLAGLDRASVWFSIAGSASVSSSAQVDNVDLPP